MFQDIYPHKLENEYKPRYPKADDLLLIYFRGKLACRLKQETVELPRVSDYSGDKENLKYLIAIDGVAIYLLNEDEALQGYEYHPLGDIRHTDPEYMAFAIVTAAHLAYWYENNKYCGRCGMKYEDKGDERALKCPKCGQVLYPTIAPVVIVGVTDGDRLLLTRYSQAHGGYKRHALNAGFVEIGESLEEAIRREIKEEVGVSVKNIRYFGSQPWGFSNSVLMGFFVDLDGDDTIKIDEDELSEAVWFNRDELPREDTKLSLTWTMIEAFRENEV